MSLTDACPVIETARLKLRPPESGDAGWIAQFCGDLGVARMTTRMPHPYSLSDAEGFLARSQKFDPAREQVFAIYGQDGQGVGLLGFHPGEDRHPEIGYWLGRPYWGKGLATEAVKAALDWARRHWGKRLISAGHFEDNEASGAVLCKAGFLYTGVVESRLSIARAANTPTRMMVWLA
jgi:RimJ/RimL family protein N-acetyltransferase